jgi:hypothetical protein
MLKRSAMLAIAPIILVTAIGGCASRSTGQAPAAQAPAAKAPARAAYSGKVLIVGYPVPADLQYEVIGPIQVFKRGYGSTGMAFHMLGDKAREVGANAVVEASAWLAPAFPANVAPHGKGIAVFIENPKALDELSKNGGRWE